MISSPFSLVPPIRRARGYRLYTADGRRLVDLWQDGGRALLGHTVPRLLNLLKDTASRGLFAPLPYPGALEKLERTVKRLFPWGELRLYNPMGGPTDRWKRLGPWDKIGPPPLPWPETVIDLACSELPPPSTAAYPLGILWRPYAQGETDAPIPLLSPELAALAQRGPLVIQPVAPVPWPLVPSLFVISREIADRFPPSDGGSPLLLRSLTRVFNDLLAAPQRPPLHLTKTPVWKSRGIYLTLNTPMDDLLYQRLWKDFLDVGFLLPPDQDLPLIVPGELSPGELRALNRALCQYPRDPIL